MSRGNWQMMNVKIPLSKAEDLPEEIREIVASSPLHVVKMSATCSRQFPGIPGICCLSYTTLDLRDNLSSTFLCAMFLKLVSLIMIDRPSFFK